MTYSVNRLAARPPSIHRHTSNPNPTSHRHTTTNTQSALTPSALTPPPNTIPHHHNHTVRLILEALISFFPTDPKGAVGSLDWTPQERRRLAVEVGVCVCVFFTRRACEVDRLFVCVAALLQRHASIFTHPKPKQQQSQTWSCPRCGPAHGLLPAEQPPQPTAPSTTSDGNGGETDDEQAAPHNNRYAAEIAQLYVRAGSGGSDAAVAAVGTTAAATDGDGGGGGEEGQGGSVRAGSDGVGAEAQGQELR